MADQQNVHAEDPGAGVRPFVVAGAPEKSDLDLDLATQVVAKPGSASADDLSMADSAALELAKNPVAIAEVAGSLGTPVLTARALVGALLRRGVLTLDGASASGDTVSDATLEYLQGVLDSVKQL
ncbi:DUF742 domain-containing protein [Saccharopolyspora rhizosphaerae]|uniref:DUF742 domain-containing protein n=1 Tax=Saccharopolyspora rhizosphaerae TaxID=2492662 RepID=A0A3R8NVK5_9PSEU|nr:DUF742 domain-containing protein [Saccharopolyspora rhizosphaerae]RRO14167.1 DUF742 domain-containing protein [Saccharopolyspora rhizosphaerae]